MTNYMGEELQIFFGSGSSATVIACATSCSVNVDADTIDVSCKDTGRYGASKPGKISWTISSDALFTIPANGDTRYGYTKLMDALISGEKVRVSWGTVSGFSTYNSASYQADEDGHVFNENNVQKNNDDLYWGYATVGSLQLTADNGALSTYSVTLNGVGKINKSGVQAGE